jgi:glutamine amidotransferase
MALGTIGSLGIDVHEAERGLDTLVCSVADFDVRVDKVVERSGVVGIAEVQVAADARRLVSAMLIGDTIERENNGERNLGMWTHRVTQPRWKRLQVLCHDCKAIINAVTQIPATSMCRLYGLSATHRTRVRCELLAAQNSLIRQAEYDGRGLSNPHGWGICCHTDDGVRCERQAEPAAEDEDFREHALELDARTAIAHIRRATVGEPAVTNTHPFVFAESMFAHNGHIPRFDAVGRSMREAMSAQHRDAIAGTTDSEHFFHLLLSNRQAAPERSMAETLAQSIEQVLEWCEAAGAAEPPALNFLWADGNKLAGSRFGRTLWWVPTHGLSECPVCGKTHAPDGAGESYQSVEFASERITSEDWISVPDASVFEVSADCSVDFTQL